MGWPMIDKAPAGPVFPNLPDYEAARAAFTWAQARSELSGLPDGRGLNMAYEAVDRHVAENRGGRLAMRWLGKSGERRDWTYAELKEASDRCANALKRLGLRPGETVAMLSGRIPELMAAALGVLKAGGVFCPLYVHFGPEPIRLRLALGGARILITTDILYQRKIAALRDQLPELRDILIIGQGELPPGTQDFAALMSDADSDFSIPATDPAAPALLHFTSGTTGMPKGAVHSHESVVGQHATARMVLDLKPDDLFWCTADTGWVTGTIYGIFAPLAAGTPCILDEGEFEPRRWYSILREEKVTVWYTTPTAVRLLMRFGAALARTYRQMSLRLALSVGEPLNAEAVMWGRDALGLPLHDTWWQTETGCIAIANFASMPIKPGSMGRPVPGIEAAIVRRGSDGLEIVTQPNVTGELALKAGWPSMFSAYLGEPDRYRDAFIDGWYLTGDLARRDADGYFWFLGRADDVIKSAGHLIGPFEVESALMDHPAVAEAGVIGRPDPVAHEVVKAFVALNPGFEAGEALRSELMSFARKQLGPSIAPKEIQFVAELPKTRSGKIVRRLLKDRQPGWTEETAPLPAHSVLEDR